MEILAGGKLGENIFVLNLPLTRFVKEASGFAAGARSFIEKIKFQQKGGYNGKGTLYFVENSFSC